MFIKLLAKIVYKVQLKLVVQNSAVALIPASILANSPVTIEGYPKFQMLGR